MRLRPKSMCVAMDLFLHKTVTTKCILLRLLLGWYGTFNLFILPMHGHKISTYLCLILFISSIFITFGYRLFTFWLKTTEYFFHYNMTSFVSEIVY